MHGLWHNPVGRCLQKPPQQGRLFSPGFQPRCCAWSVRRGPGYDIEGVVAVEEDGQAIHAMCDLTS